MKEIFNLKTAKTLIVSAVISVLTSVILIFVLAWILCFSSVPENVSDAAVMFIANFSVFLGGFICARINKIRGLIFGSLNGILYFLIVYVVSCFCAMRADFSQVSISEVLFLIISSALGGILAVNIKRKK